MSSSELFFLIEVNIEEFVSHIKCDKLRIVCTFSDIFTFNMMDPKSSQKTVSQGQTKLLRKSMVRSLTTKKLMKPKLQTKHSTIISYDAKHLIKKMQKYPIQISLRKKLKNSKNLGSTEFVWEKPFLDYIRTVNLNQKNIPTIRNTKHCIVLNEVTSKKIASFKTTVKLSIVANHTIKLNASLNSSSSIKCKESKANVLTRFKKSANNVSSATILKNNNKLQELFTGLSQQVLQETHENKTKVTKFKQDNKIIWNNLIKSDINLNINKTISLRKSKSTSTIEVFKSSNILKYIYGDGVGIYNNRVYYVGYFTVATDTSKDKTSVSKSDKVKSSGKASGSSESICLFSEPVDLSYNECKNVRCENKEHRPLHKIPDKQILLDLESIYKECCVKTEEVEGEVTAKMKFGNDPCFCTCECSFGYTKKTTYCHVCGGYEKVGEDFPQKPKYDMPVACPVFHKIIDKSKFKMLSMSGSDTRRKDELLGAKSTRTGSKSGTSSEKRSNAEKKSDSEKDRKKGRKANDDRFKFNYGYKGIPPQIGHCYCAMPCTGTLNPVPKKMGWLWTADNVPGLKYDPQWKPGAIHKFVYRLLKIAKNPDEVGKKRRKDTGKKKRPLKRPLLVVFKQNGEYTVTVETMKPYPKPRNINQQPYEDKPVMTYTIGRTEEENRARQKKKERQQRRLERAQRLFIQSAFKDMCNEICLKTYQQALGILPDAEDPTCPCYPAEPGPDKTNINVSCSCSEVSSSFNSDTDSDEWAVEFTPPSAFFDPKTKVKKVNKTDSSAQYTYLDFRVKLSDRYGNPVPRFFIGPDGKQQCSDLGGFWSPDHKWLEINIDGYVAPDGRWAPNNFTGPNGEAVDAETGKFQAINGKWLVVGIDGYVDVLGKWRFYSKARGLMKKADKKIAVKYDKTIKSDKTVKTVKTENKSSWSCFGDVSPMQLSKMGITCHGSDRKLLIKKLQELKARGEKVKIPAFPSSGLTTGKRRKKFKYQKPPMTGTTASESKCMHAKPSDKGIEAIDADGNKIYFHPKKFINKRPKERMEDLLKRGISLSSFHVPCLRSFINAEIMKREQRKRLLALAARHG